MYKNLSLLLPAKNELSCIDKVFKELEKINFNSQVLLVVDSIKDNTLKFKKKKYSFKIIKIITNKKGYGAAVIEGIKKCKTKKVCIFNADGSFLSRELKEMYKYLKEYDFDFVFGSRYMKNGYSEDDTIITLIGNRIFSFLGKIFFSLEISDILYTYVMGDTEKAKGLEMKEKKFAFCVELPIKAKKRGYKLVSIPSYEKPRIAGRKKVNAFKDGLIILFSMIKFFIFK